MICNELINGQQRRNVGDHDNKRIDLGRYHRLPLVTRKLISGWFTLASTRLENDEYNCFEAFIFAWIAFNGWASCISGIDQDRTIILALKKYEPISTKFEEMFDSDACFRSYATQFSQFWPIFGCHAECCVTTYKEKVLNSVQTGLPGFSAMYYYTTFGMASSILAFMSHTFILSQFSQKGIDSTRRVF